MKKGKYSFKDWCLDNNHQDFLDLWDYDLNDKDPSEVSYGSGKKYYFKCSRNLHESELKKLNNITSQEKIICFSCNSFYQWCIDNEHEDWLLLWDYDKNIKTPWDIAAKSNKKYYFKCPKNIHDSELKYILDITSGKSNLFCIACKSIGQYIIDTYGEDALNDIWSIKNNVSPFEIYAMGEKKCWFCCKDKTHPDYLMHPKMYVQGQRCSVCSGHSVLVGFNDIATTHPYLVKFFKDEKDTEKYTYGSGKSTFMKCPICGYETQMQIRKLVEHGFSCPCCGDGHSYPNKFMYSVLNQLHVEYTPEYSPKWADGKRYDLYCEIFNLIIENHGEQHYRQVGFKRTLKEEQENDKNKKQMATNNGIDKYIVIDCRKSEMNYIKNSVMQSELPNLLRFNEDEIDWKLCADMARKSMVKQACDMWNNGCLIKDIANQLKICVSTVRRYLIQGTDCGLCDYSLRKNKSKKIA